MREAIAPARCNRFGAPASRDSINRNMMGVFEFVNNKIAFCFNGLLGAVWCADNAAVNGHGGTKRPECWRH